MNIALHESRVEGMKTEAGSGGKQGHSNMSHWDHTEEVKRTARKARRVADKTEIDLDEILAQEGVDGILARMEGLFVVNP